MRIDPTPEYTVQEHIHCASSSYMRGQYQQDTGNYF